MIVVPAVRNGAPSSRNSHEPDTNRSCYGCVIAVLADLGLWVSEPIGLDVEDLGGGQWRTAEGGGPDSRGTLCRFVTRQLGGRAFPNDQFRTGRYQYFYEPTILTGKDSTVSADGRVRLSQRYPGGKESNLTFWLHFVPMPVQVGAVTSPQSMMSPLRVDVKEP